MCHPVNMKRDAGTSAMEMRQSDLVVIKPTDMERAGMAGTHLPAVPGASRGRGATIGRNLADSQCLAAMLSVGLREFMATGVRVLVVAVKGRG